MKLSKLNIAIASGLSLTLLSGAAIAAFPGAIGDSRVHFPLQQQAAGTTVGTDSTDVWFVAADDADGYLVDLRSLKNAAGDAIGDCADVTTDGVAATTPTDVLQKFIPVTSPDISCGLESVATLAAKGVTGDADTNAARILCKWKTPVLADGKYILAINSLKFGVEGGPEALDTCNDTAALGDNKHEIPVYTAAGEKSASYQQFEIKKVGGAATQKPDGVTLTAPGFEGGQDGVLVAGFAGAADTYLKFEDASPVAGKATWYEVFIYDKNNVRVGDIVQDNLAFNNWYKTGVDAAGIQCTPDKVKADGSKFTECVIDLESLTVNTTTGAEAGLSTVGDKFTWWIRGYNDEFGAGPWSSKGTFKSAD